MEKIIIVVSKHRRFGWKFYIYWGREQPNDRVEILGTPKANDGELKGMSDIDCQLIRLIDEVSDASLMRAYSRQTNLLAFMEEVTQRTIDNLIRPRIELNCRRIVELASQSSLPVYLRNDLSNKMLYAPYLVGILPASSRCIFNFVKDDAGLRYFISLSNDQQEMSLQRTTACILSQNPCVILLGRKIHRVENVESKKLTPFFNKPHINVPAATEKLYINNFILKTIPKYEVKIEGLEMTEIHPVRQAVLVLDEDLHQHLTFFVYFRYDHHQLNPALRKVKFVELQEIDGVETICWFTRDREWEKQHLDMLVALGLRQEGDNRFYPNYSVTNNELRTAEQECDNRFHPNTNTNPEPLPRFGLINWLNANIKNLTAFIIEQKIGTTYYAGSITLQSNIETKIDWFDVEIDVVFDDFKMPFSRFRRHILDGIIEYILPDKTVFILPEVWFHRFPKLFVHGNETDKGIKIKKMHVGLIDESVTELFAGKKNQELLDVIRLPDERPALSESMNTILRRYQKEGFYWLTHLYRWGLGGCLADDMGLGKTLQTISLLDYIYAHAGVKTDGQPSLFALWESILPASLIVVPKSLLHNWQNEVRRFAPDLKVYVYADDKRIRTGDIGKIFDRYQIVITSYGIARADIEYLQTYRFLYVVLDESQNIKNPESLLYKTVCKLDASHKLILTGTPVENSLTDLWAQFNFINPGLLGSFSLFKTNYAQKIRENNRQAEKTLQQLIQPFFLRRTKEEVTPELPPLSQEIVYCDMTDSQREIYVMEKSRIRNDLFENREREVRNSFVALQGLLRLRLLANHPVLTYRDYADDSGKFDQVVLYFESLMESGHKVLIFSSFVKHLKLLSAKFDREGWKYAMLTGQTTRREDEIARFIHDDDIHCFFITLKAGGVGLNLTVADYVFILDPWWNPAAEMQALSRAHRIGQDKHVIVYRFISSDTVEEKIMLLQQSKLQLSETFITSNNPLDQLDKKEMEALFL